MLSADHEMMGLGINMGCDEEVPLGHVPVCPHVQSGRTHLPLESSEHFHLHLSNLLYRVAVVGGSCELPDFRSDDFLESGE